MTSEEVLKIAKECGAVAVHSEWDQLSLVRNEAIKCFADAMYAAGQRDAEFKFLQENDITCKLEELKAEREVSDKLLEALNKIADTGEGEGSHQYMALTAIAEVEAMRKESGNE